MLDASAVIDLLVRSGRGERLRAALQGHDNAALFTVAHLDAEVLSGLARSHRASLLDAEEVTEGLHRLSQLPVARLPITGELLDAAWALRGNVSARDALYVAAARGLQASLVTTDQRLARAVPDLVDEPS